MAFKCCRRNHKEIGLKDAVNELTSLTDYPAELLLPKSSEVQVCTESFPFSYSACKICWYLTLICSFIFFFFGKTQEAGWWNSVFLRFWWSELISVLESLGSLCPSPQTFGMLWCNMNHTLFYFRPYRLPKYCGCVAARFYSRHFRSLDQVVFLPELQICMGKTGWIYLPSSNLWLFTAAREHACYLNVCCHRLQCHAVTVQSFMFRPVRGMSKWRTDHQVAWWSSCVC